MRHANLSGKHLEYRFLYFTRIGNAWSMAVLREKYGKLARLARHIRISQAFVFGYVFI